MVMYNCEVFAISYVSLMADEIKEIVAEFYAMMRV